VNAPTRGHSARDAHIEGAPYSFHDQHFPSPAPQEWQDAILNATATHTFVSGVLTWSS